MSGRSDLEEVLRASGSKAEAVRRLGVNPITIRQWAVDSPDPYLFQRWRTLPGGGAFADASRAAPKPSKMQSVCDALVAQAVEQCPIDPTVGQGVQRRNMVGLLLAMYAVSGTLNWHRGWVRSVMREFENAGAEAPPPQVVRWYRSQLQANAGQFLGTWGIDKALLLLIADR